MQTIPNFYIQQSAYSPIHLKLGLPASFDYAHTHSSSLAQIIWSILYYEDELRNYIVTIKKYQISWEKYFGRNILSYIGGSISTSKSENFCVFKNSDSFNISLSFRTFDSSVHFFKLALILSGISGYERKA
jgi:hypothetical protein